MSALMDNISWVDGIKASRSFLIILKLLFKKLNKIFICKFFTLNICLLGEQEEF